MSQNKILYILPIPRFFSQLNNIGGHVTHVFGIVNSFIKQGYHVHIYSEEIIDILRDNERISSTIIFSKFSNIFCRQIWAIRLIFSIKKHVIHNKYDFCYIRYSTGFALWYPLLKIYLKNIPLIIEVNSFALQRINKSFILRIIEKNALGVANLIVAVSDKVKFDITNLLSTKLSKKVAVIPNGVDVERFNSALSNISDKKNTQFSIAYVGVLKYDYGLEELIDAFKKVQTVKKNVFLHIVGEGPFLKELKKISKNISNIIFHGSVAFQEIPNLLQSFDILINTSSQKIVFQSPTKIFEYMAAGKPIISADNPQVSKILKNGECGILYPMNNTNIFAEKILELINNPDLRNKIAKNALKEVSKFHSWDARVNSIIKELNNKLE